MKEYAYGQTFETYLDNFETRTISNVYFSIGGSGGARAEEVDAQLRDNYGFNDDDLLYLGTFQPIDIHTCSHILSILSSKYSLAQIPPHVTPSITIPTNLILSHLSFSRFSERRSSSVQELLTPKKIIICGSTGTMLR